MPLADILPQSPKGTACFGDSLVDLRIDGSIAGEGAAQVGESLYRLEGLSVHLYLWLLVLVPWSWLKHHVSLLGADGKTEVVTG